MKVHPPMLYLMLLAIGLLMLYVPTYIGLMQWTWQNSDQSHAPLVVLIVAFLFWNKRHFLQLNNTTVAERCMGIILIFIGLLSYLLGRSQDIVMLDLGSQLWVLAGLILVYCGYRSLLALWFPIFFIIFMLPLPLDAITLPMKMAVSHVTEAVLYYFGYPIAREGVILQIGQYQLMVADACAGMQTLISLEALGLLYLNLNKHQSVIRNVMLALLIVPISFFANVIRVITLTLITFHFGNAAGQGFIHGFAGLFLFVVALLLIIVVDTALQVSLQTTRKWRVT